MPYTFEDLAARERRRWVRENAHLYIRPDAHRFMRPDAERFLRPGQKLDRYWERPEFQSPAMRAYARPPVPARVAGYAQSQSIAGAAAPAPKSGPSHGELLKLKADLAALRRDLAAVGLAMAERKTRGLPPGVEANPLWRDYLRKQAAFDEAWRKAGFEDGRRTDFRDDRKAGFKPDQLRVPAGHADGGQWISGGSADGRNTGGGANDPRVLSDATPDNTWIPGAQYAQAAPRSGSRAAAPTDVVLPDGSKIPDEKSPTGYMQSPVADLSPVAQAGRKTGEIYRSLLESPEGGAGAIGFLGLSMYRDLSQGGTFDYQREANPNGRYTQLSHYRNVSNFNVGLYSQQAGLTLHETLSIAGFYARFRSSNARPEEPYALPPDTRRYTEYGYEVGRRGLLGTLR